MDGHRLAGTAIAPRWTKETGRVDVPFPSRILLLIAATLAGDGRQLIGLVVATTAGSLIGDHVPYLAGAMTGPRILAFYCRITLGS
jgi:membrane protein DedA with SNARE-associated domain